MSVYAGAHSGPPSIFKLNKYKAALLALIGGLAMALKYNLLGDFIAYLPAIMSNTTITVPPEVTFIVVIVMDYLQKLIWSGGIDFVNGSWIDRLIGFIIISFFPLECYAIAMQFFVPDLLINVSTGDLPAVFATRLQVGLAGEKFLVTYFIIVLVVFLAVLPEFFLEQASRVIEEKYALAWFVMGFVGYFGFAYFPF